MLDRAFRFPELLRLRDRVEAAFREVVESTEVAETWRPAVEIYTEGESYRIVFEVPGRTAGDLQLVCRDRSLLLTGAEVAESPGRSLRRERSRGRFSVVVPLPGYVDPAGLAAQLHAGVLTVSLPRPPAGREASIPIEELGD
jgi:HSP20 family protein